MYQLYKMSVHKDVEEFYILDNDNYYFTTHSSTENVVNEYSSQFAKGMIGLLCLCPQEVANLLKELLVAARHILATELRDKYKLFRV
nr:transformation/transcription domain-associated protein-like [Parasteatoda tepidariorum]